MLSSKSISHQLECNYLKTKTMNQTLALVIFCTPTTFFYFLGGAFIVEINSLKYIFLFIAVCGTRSHCIFFADDCEKKIIGGVPIVQSSWPLNADHLL